MGGRKAYKSKYVVLAPSSPPPKLYPFPALVGPRKSSGLIFILLYIKSYPPWKSLPRFLRTCTTRCLSRKRVECWNSRDSLCSERSLDNGSCVHKNTVINRAKGSDFGQRTARFSPLTYMMSEFHQFSSYQMISESKWDSNTAFKKKRKKGGKAQEKHTATPAWSSAALSPLKREHKSSSLLNHYKSAITVSQPSSTTNCSCSISIH